MNNVGEDSHAAVEIQVGLASIREGLIVRDRIPAGSFTGGVHGDYAAKDAACLVSNFLGHAVVGCVALALVTVRVAVPLRFDRPVSRGSFNRKEPVQDVLHGENGRV